MIDTKMARSGRDALTSAQERTVARRAASLDDELQLLLESRGQLSGPESDSTGSWASRRIAQVDRLRASMAAADTSASVDAADLWREAEAMRWKLALSAWHLAQRESRRTVVPELTRGDIANEAALGLYDAAVRFDPERGFVFSTYARWWIRAQMKGTIADAHLIVRLPDSARRRRARLMRGGETTGGRDDSVAHLRYSFASVSWQQLPRGDDGLTLEETTSDPAARRVDDDLESTEALAGARQAVFDSDDGVHRSILLERFGLAGGEPQTLRQLGAKIGVSAERVRQLEGEALSTLKDQVDRANALPTTAAKRSCCS